MPISHAAARVCAVLCVTLAAFSASAEQQGQPRASTKAPTTIEQGPLAQACGVRGKALGSPVEKGPGKWKLYDTQPGSTAPRDFYLTGFSDGCPRRITAAVAMFGSVALYEAVHYGPVGLKPKGDATDAAYAQLRARTCGSSKSACSEREIRRLERSAAFLSVYPSKGSPSRLELLMTRGRLAAVAQK
ncbi:hypothetical protein [Tropicimonas aquimaris]|uniref:Uncharacterized protein n=1 Tax=Tropicimonas aquimaris TaxID=914152 RepID=A0ABW3IJ97_9RHOB